MTTFPTLKDATDYWQNTEEANTTIYRSFWKSVKDDKELNAHRDFVKYNNFGYGNRGFHWMWTLLHNEFPENFKFLEIGVFQGQIISLMSLLNKRTGKKGEIYGITPLAPADDKYSKHPNINYEERIAILYNQFGLDASDLTLITGLSTTPSIIETAKSVGPFDCLYIDGGHDYETVVNDIVQYGPMVKVGGYLVMDDSANYMRIPDGVLRLNWRGLEDVSNAVRDHLEPNTKFKHILCVGHNRIWQKVEE